MATKDVLARRGEAAAARYLKDAGWEVLDRNWRCRDGELDIVALDGPDLVVCEVKTRSALTYGTPAEGVSSAKAARLRRLACRWLAEHDVSYAAMRIDIVGLVSDGPDHFTVDHMRGVC